MRQDIETTATDRERLLEQINACWTTQAIGTAVVLSLPQRLANEARTTDGLAADCGCHAASLRRLLRALAALGLTEEHLDDRYTLTDTGRLLLPDEPHSLHTWAGLRVAHWDAWGGLVESVRTGRSHRERRAGRSDFAHLGADPDLALRFHRAIGELTRRIAPALVDALALRGDERVIDVGGGEGELLVALARAHPCLHGVVFEQPHARRAAISRLEREGLLGRCGFIDGDFFAGLPADAGLLLLKSVLHNWDDAHCERLLRGCRGAMLVPGARLAVIERVCPPRMSATRRDRELAASDLNMLVHLGGRERTLGELEALLTASGLCTIRSQELPAGFTLIEAGIRPDTRTGEAVQAG